MSSLKNRLNQKGSLNIYNEYKSDSNVIQSIDISILNVIENQPFKEYTNSTKYTILKESIKSNGISNPLIVRELIKDNITKYYILSGRHRYLVAKELNLSTVPCILKRNISDDEANIILLDCNLCQREELLPSELAYSYKQKLDIMNRQGKRTDLSNDEFSGKQSVNILANQLGTYSTIIKQHIKLTELIYQLLDEVDNKRISISSAYSLAFLKSNEQEIVFNVLKDNHIKITNKISKSLKELSEKGLLTDDTIYDILLKKPSNKSLSTKDFNASFKNICNEYLKDYINEDLNFNQAIQLIQNALKNYNE